MARHHRHQETSLSPPFFEWYYLLHREITPANSQLAMHCFLTVRPLSLIPSGKWFEVESKDSSNEVFSYVMISDWQRGNESLWFSRSRRADQEMIPYPLLEAHRIQWNSQRGQGDISIRTNTPSTRLIDKYSVSITVVSDFKVVCRE